MKKNGFNSRFCAKDVIVGQVLPDNAPVKGHLAAFTLIELLVVVLIIGILAAVALPQYKLAVTKTHVATILPILKAITQGNAVYYLSNGNYSTNINNLDIFIAGECKPTDDVTGRDGQTWQCGKYFLVDNSGGLFPGASYCPYKNTDVATCFANRDFVIQYDRNETLSCITKNESNFGNRICDSISRLFVHKEQ